MKATRITRLLLLFIAVLLCSCSEKRTVIGVSQCCGGLWREKVNNEMMLAQHEYNNVDLVFASAESDGQLQARQIDSMVAAKVDLIVVAPDNVDDVTPAIERAYSKGIPVVLFDRKAKSSNYTAYIGGDNVEAGREVARFMAKKLEGHGTVVEITGLRNTSPVMERHRGFMEVMKDYPNLKIVTLDSDWKTKHAQQLFKQYLDRGGHADGVFGHNDLSAIGAFQEAERRKIEKQITIVGIDGLPGKWEGVDRVQKGQFAASYVYPTQGEKIISLAMDILQGKPYKKENTMQSFLATIENCDAIALQYQELETKMKSINRITGSLDTYAEENHLQRWMLGLGSIIVIMLLLAIYYIYKVYHEKLEKQKEVARGFIDNKEGWVTELTHVDETERFFIDRFKKKLLEHLADANLKTEDLGAEMQLSKVQLYRKVKAITGKTPVELLKEMRLAKAYTLLQKTDKSVAEIAAEVGFAVPGYFSVCFKKQYGVNPTEIRG